MREGSRFVPSSYQHLKNKEEEERKSPRVDLRWRSPSREWIWEREGGTPRVPHSPMPRLLPVGRISGGGPRPTTTALLSPVSPTSFNNPGQPLPLVFGPICPVLGLRDESRLSTRLFLLTPLVGREVRLGGVGMTY